MRWKYGKKSWDLENMNWDILVSAYKECQKKNRKETISQNLPEGIK